MASLYVLYIGDNIVGPCLELIRKICDPNSTSKPHVTVRGPIRRKTLDKPNLKNAEITEIELMQPGIFVSHNDSDLTRYTVFVLCNLKKNLWIHQKPDYPTSLPHITLYDGKSKKFAEKLYKLLQNYQWHLPVLLPEKTTLSNIRLKSNKNKIDLNNYQYNSVLFNLFKKITNLELEFNYVKNLSDKNRLHLVDLICEYLEKQLNRKKDEIIHTKDSLRIEQKNSFQVWDDLKKIYGTKQQELDLLKQSHRHAHSFTPRESRSRLGQFLTPPELAIEIAKYVKDKFKQQHPIHFGDPSIGTGTFFSALRQVFPIDSIASAIGIEIDKSIASTTSRLWGKQGLKVIENDFFQTKDIQKRNMILSNPPYVRHHYIHPNQKEILRNRVRKEIGIEVSGLSGLYIYFILLCHRWMSENAIAAWLIPSEFMETKYGVCLRRYLTENVTLHLIHRFDPNEVQFEGVIVTSSVVIFQKKRPNPEHVIKFSFGGNLSSPKQHFDIALNEIISRDKWPTNMHQFHRKKSSSIQLNDLFSIKRGIATGANSFFIIDRKRARNFGIPESCLRPILPSPRNLLTEIVKNESDGYPMMDPQLSVINCSLSEKDIKRLYPKFWEYLKKAKALGIKDGYLVRSRKLWYKQEDREPPPYLCTYLGRDKSTGTPFRFIWNRSNAIATNGYLCLYPREMLSTELKNRPNIQKIIFELLQSIKVVDLRDSSRVYGGGLFKLEPKDFGEVNADVFIDFIAHIDNRK